MSRRLFCTETQTKCKGIFMTVALQKIEQMPFEYDQSKIELLKSTVCKGASNDEFELFLHVCKRTGLDPFMKQIYSIPRGGQRTIQTSIDGLRLIAERTGKYSPGKQSIYEYNENKQLLASTSFVMKMTADGTWHEVAYTAMFAEYNPGVGSFWKKMPHVMLSKVAEAAALRKAFPAEMSGIYTKEEMAQSDKQDDEEIKIEKILSYSDLDEYFSSKGDQKDKFREFFFMIKDSRKWSDAETLEALKKDEKYTKEAFEKWVLCPI